MFPRLECLGKKLAMLKASLYKQWSPEVSELTVHLGAKETCKLLLAS